MSKMMKAMVLDAVNEELVLKDLPMPEPQAGEVRIKVKANGICYTDIKIQKGLLPGGKTPVVMGHEIAGVVDELGAGVTEFAVGDRVAVYSYNTCGECYYCKQGLPFLCEDLKGQAGLSINGGYEEYMVWPSSGLVRIPDNLSFEAAAVTTDAVSTGYHALCERISLKEGDSILIMGVGGLGINAVQIAKARGAMVIAADIDDQKLEMAKSCGADYVFNTKNVNLPDECRKVTNGRGVTYSAEFVGSTLTTELAFKCLAEGGTQVQPGYYPGHSFQVDFMDLVKGERSIIASRACTKDSLQGAMDLVASGKVEPQIDPTAIFSLENANEALARLQAGKVIGRAVIKYD